MAANLQEVYNRINETKKKIKDIRGAYKDALAGTGSYQEIKEKIQALQMKKKQIEAGVKEGFSSELDKLDELNLDLKSDNMLLTDAAMSRLMKGETVELVDEYDNRYEPEFSVRFKKV